MAYEQRDNSGSIFQNDKKTTDSHPGWKGSALISGVDYWVSGWVKTAKDGKKWVSLAFDVKQPAAVAQSSASAPIPSGADFNDIPF